jgi:hypothetical protein
VNLDNEVVGIITRKDIAAPIASTSINLKIKTAKKSTVLKGQQLKVNKRRGTAALSRNDEGSDLPYEELRS